MTELITPRLELRRWKETDLDQYASIVADPEVNRHVGGPQDRATAWRQIAIMIGHREMRGWTSSAVIERKTGRLIGRGGLYHPEGWPGTEVGWILARHAWGHGYATDPETSTSSTANPPRNPSLRRVEVAVQRSQLGDEAPPAEPCHLPAWTHPALTRPVSRARGASSRQPPLESRSLSRRP